MNSIYRIMQLTSILLLGLSLSLSAKTLSQQISFSAKKVPLEKVFAAIEDQTDFLVMFNAAETDKAPLVSVDAKNVSLGEFLAMVLKDQPFAYAIEGNTIFVREKAGVGKPAPGLFKEIPPITVKGRIVNENGEPVVASVVVKGTNRGTTSDATGKFELNNINEEAVLIISATNIETFSINVNKQESLLVTVKTIASSLEEVVVNKGYYSESRRLTTGSVAKVGFKDIEKQPVSNPLQTLQGRMPGVYVQQSSGLQGAGVTIEIRGRNSLRLDGNTPLYIVDGIPVPANGLTNSNISSSLYLGAGSSPFNTLNPADIESLEVLKDADATAIYGSRGANGVVLITTKRAKSGRTKFDADIRQGYGKVASKMDLLDTKQYLEMRWEALKNDNVTPNPNSSGFRDLFKWDTIRYTDWQKELIGGTAKTLNVQASVSGGTERTQFLISGGFYRETSVFPGNFDYKKGTLHSSINHESLNKKFSIFLSSIIAVDDNNLPRYDITSNALTLSPNAPALYDVNGDLNWENGTFANPLASYAEPVYSGKTKNTIINSLIKYNIFSFLQLKANLGYTNIQLDEFATTPISSNNPIFGVTTGSASFSHSNSNTWIVEPQVEFNKMVGPGNLTALMGLSFQESVLQGQTVSADGFRSDELLENIKFATGLSPLDFNYIQNKYNSVFGRINYNIDGKYVINLTGRRDGSSRFGPDKRFANFGAIGAAWIFSNEKFIKENNVISFGKLRGSFGTTGSDQIGDYQYMDTYSASPYPYNGIAGLLPTQLVNPDYAWETNKKIEIGLDLGFLRDRLMLSASYYRNRSSNQLVGYALPITTGFASIQYNLPATVQNTGIELGINAEIVKSLNFLWSSSFNITIPRNKLVAFPNIKNYPVYINRYDIGRSVNLVKGFKFLGVDSQAGAYVFEDVDGNGVGRDYPADLQSTKEIGQRFYGGFQNSINWKSFALDVMIQFVKQTGYNYITSFGLPGTAANQPTEVLKRWQKPGDNTDVQRYASGRVINDAYFGFYNGGFGDNRISDASFIRVKNISLSWSLPERWLTKIHTQKISLYVTGQNLLTISDYIGLDPETQRTFSLPPLRMITMGIKATL